MSFSESHRRQPSIAALRREIDDIVRCAPNVLKLSLMPPLHIKARSRLQPDKPSENVP